LTRRLCFTRQRPPLWKSSHSETSAARRLPVLRYTQPAGWPWSVLRGVYTRIGASEGINRRRLRDVDLAAVARSFAERYPKRRFAAILLGASNGALTHLAAAMQVRWLPGTVLIPVSHVGDTDRPDQAMEFGHS
jgi:hypothetical protein